MENDEKVIKSMSAQSYNGRYLANEGNYKIEGLFNADGQKNLNNIGGSVISDNTRRATFSAWRNNEALTYSFGDIIDTSELAAISEAVEAAVAAVEAELAE